MSQASIRKAECKTCATNSATTFGVYLVVDLLIQQMCCVTAVHGEYAAPPVDGKLYGEADWNETSTVENGQAYHLSKVTANRFDTR